MKNFKWTILIGIASFLIVLIILNRNEPSEDNDPVKNSISENFYATKIAHEILSDSGSKSFSSLDSIPQFIQNLLGRFEQDDFSIGDSADLKQGLVSLTDDIGLRGDTLFTSILHNYKVSNNTHLITYTKGGYVVNYKVGLFFEKNDSIQVFIYQLGNDFFDFKELDLFFDNNPPATSIHTVSRNMNIRGKALFQNSSCQPVQFQM